MSTGNIQSRLAGRKSEPKTTTAGTCPRCHKTAHITSHDPVCSPCGEAIRREAAREQEQAYLIAWLSSRIDARGRPVPDSALTTWPADRRQVQRLVKLARRSKLTIGPDVAPPVVYFELRLSQHMAPYKPGTARPRGRPPKLPANPPSQAGERYDVAGVAAHAARSRQGVRHA